MFSITRKVITIAAAGAMTLAATGLHAAIPTSLLKGSAPSSEYFFAIDLTAGENQESLLSLFPADQAFDEILNQESMMETDGELAAKSKKAREALLSTEMRKKFKSFAISGQTFSPGTAKQEPVRMVFSGSFTRQDLAPLFQAYDMTLPDANTVTSFPMEDGSQLFANVPADGFLILGGTEEFAMTKMEGSAGGVLNHAMPIAESGSEMAFVMDVSPLRPMASQLGPVAQMAQPLLQAHTMSLSTMAGSPPSLNLLLEFDDPQKRATALQFAQVAVQGYKGQLNQQKTQMAQQGMATDDIDKTMAVLNEMEMTEKGDNLHVKLPIELTEEMRQQIQTQILNSFNMGLQQGMGNI